LSPFGATILRVMLGVVYIAHAYHAYFDVTPDAMAAMITKDLGLPFPDALVFYLLTAQLMGGIMFVLGFFTRWAALVNVPVMLVVVLILQLNEGFFLRAVMTEAARGKTLVVGYEYALVVLIATIAQFFLGGGTWALTKDT
jgi:putative oxidoreductase